MKPKYLIEYDHPTLKQIYLSFNNTWSKHKLWSRKFDTQEEAEKYAYDNHIVYTKVVETV